MSKQSKQGAGTMVRSPSGDVLGFKSPIPVTTTFDLPGVRVTQVVGIARGNTIRARHLGNDILAGFRAMIGGEIVEYTRMVAESREQAFDRMVESALAMGANAIIGMRFETCSMMQGAAELVAYGTAVIIEEEPRA